MFIFWFKVDFTFIPRKKPFTTTVGFCFLFPILFVQFAYMADSLPVFLLIFYHVYWTKYKPLLKFTKVYLMSTLWAQTGAVQIKKKSKIRSFYHHDLDEATWKGCATEYFAKLILWCVMLILCVQAPPPKFFGLRGCGPRSLPLMVWFTLWQTT